MGFKETFQEYDAKVSSKFFKKTPEGKKPQWIKIVLLWIVIIVVLSILSVPTIISDVNTIENTYMVNGELYDYPSNYELSSNYSTGQFVYSPEGSFCISYQEYTVSPEDMQKSIYESNAESGKNPSLVNRTYNGVSYYGVKYSEGNSVVESGFFNKDGVTRQYIILDNPPENDINSFFNNIHF
ncbi:hypothetical protein [Methanobrevibacter sp. DSM 116169]|uniref:hypothetical protein n=1 Tax=Methanobrevibacter sp. DSM 116169 TaxID=3242727 RepID=UPI0038FCA796